ncbi:MAG: oxygenase MpaB family protein [Myxococcota bacterium]
MRAEEVEAPADAGERLIPLGPDSLSWRYAGDLRAVLLLPRAALLEAMHPVVGAGLSDFSSFMADPWGRATRTRESMITSVYGGPAAIAETARLRRLHRKFEGTDAQGRRYSALDPVAYTWVWATVFQAVVDSRLQFARPLSADALRRLYGEFRQVGRMLSVGEQNMPPDLPSLDAFCRRILVERLETTPYSRDFVRFMRGGRAMPPPPGWFLPEIAWTPGRRTIGRLISTITLGNLPPEAREILGIRWNRRAARRLDRITRLVRATVSRLPRAQRYHPRAWAAIQTPDVTAA